QIHRLLDDAMVRGDNQCHWINGVVEGRGIVEVLGLVKFIQNLLAEPQLPLEFLHLRLGGIGQSASSWVDGAFRTAVRSGGITTDQRQTVRRQSKCSGCPGLLRGRLSNAGPWFATSRRSLLRRLLGLLLLHLVRPWKSSHLLVKGRLQLL